MTGSPLSLHFRERVLDYGVHVSQCAWPDLPGAVAEALAGRALGRLAIPGDLPDLWLEAVSCEGLQILRDEPLERFPSAGASVRGAESVGGGGRSEPLGKNQLARADGALTGCAFAIAETGTIVMDGGRAQGRRILTLLPDYHLCVVSADQVVEDVPEAMARLEESVRNRRAPITFISGPSATSDIELRRVVGVHGPRTLEVILVGDPWT
jgi:L-lactate dehydrogenase complex protein LldG